MLEAVLAYILDQPADDITFFLDTGGTILYGIAIVTFVLWALMLERMWYFGITFPRRVKKIVAAWQSRSDQRSWLAHKIREGWISEARSELNSTLPMIAALIAICPLFGLLGTVTGMVQVFDVMAVVGTSNARAMAAGVSQATIPTMAGMVVAVSGLIFSNRFKRRAQLAVSRMADSMTFGVQHEA